MLTEDKIIKKKIHYEGVVKKRTNHVTYEDVDGTEKYRIKGKKNPEQQPKPAQREILDNYRYIETKILTNERRKSIVKHQRLGSPVGKETPYFRDYNTNTSYVPKRQKLSNENRHNQNKYSEKTMDQRRGKIAKKYITQTQYSNSSKEIGIGPYSFNSPKCPHYKKKHNIGQLSFSGSKYRQNKNIQQKYNLQKGETNYGKYKNYKGINLNLEKNIITAGDMNLDQNSKIIGQFKLEETKDKINDKENQEVDKRMNYNKNIESQVDINLEQNENEKESLIKKTHKIVNSEQNLEPKREYILSQNLDQKGVNIGRSRNIQQNINYRQNSFENQFNSPCQNKTLPFYPSSEQISKYQSQTEKLIICRNCGRPKRPKEHQRTISFQENRNYFNREIIGEQRKLGDYSIGYNEPNLNQFNNEIYKNQLNLSQQRFEQGLRESKNHFCPVHGYV